jgi:anti-sigma regulatory factor (Ser/Thr protein kinase)
MLVVPLSARLPPSAQDDRHLLIHTRTDAAVARALVLRFAKARGLEHLRAAELALVASEMVSNVVKYAGTGELILDANATSVIVATHDRGPGPPSEAELFADGVSRGAPRLPEQSIATGLGTGGGAIRRLCDRVELLARPGGGTILRCYKFKSPPR